MEDFAKWLVTQYGLPGAFICFLLYDRRTIWKDNVDLRARYDRLADRFVGISAVTMGDKSEVKL